MPACCWAIAFWIVSLAHLVSFVYTHTNTACGYSDSCILIFSDVSIYSVLNDDIDEESVRRETTAILRDVINGDTLEETLARRIPR